MIDMLQCKLHRATVTAADLEYEGSVSIDPRLIEATGLRIHQRVEIWDVTNGARLSTYVIEGAPGQVQMNGAAAHLVNVGDIIIIAAYCQLDEAAAETHEPTVVLLGDGNVVKSVVSGSGRSGAQVRAEIDAAGEAAGEAA